MYLEAFDRKYFWFRSKKSEDKKDNFIGFSWYNIDEEIMITFLPIGISRKWSDMTKDFWMLGKVEESDI